jgi:UDP-N-acetylglucosamine diphosphorylase/glucosamine-1-phosphate N-acetyltransferase
MSHLHFFESPGAWTRLLPLTYTRPVADLRVGILKISEKWTKHLGASSMSFGTEAYLNPLFPASFRQDALHIAAHLLPDDDLVAAIKRLDENQVLVNTTPSLRQLAEGQGGVLAFRGNASIQIAYSSPVSLVSYPWDIFRLTKQEIERDFDLITAGRTSTPLSDPHTKTYGSRIFLEEGATVKAAVLNAETGAIYLGKHSEVQEGAVIRGALALCEGSAVNMGAKMRGDSTVGPFSKVGGEVSNSVLQGFSNKGHDGFLGNSVLGEWCNLGADTNNSNLKNNYENVKMWDFESGRFKDTGLQFCGLIMGDHSKAGINTMFNTGTTVGVSANIFGDGFPRTIIPSFAWGGAAGFTTFQMNKALETARLVMARRNKELTDGDKAVLTHIFEATSAQRVWEKK